jgi:outer membrane receptor protein involved in Fe transport
MTDWSPDTTFINFFILDRTIHSVYASYDRRLGRFDLMGGLRLEQEFLSTDLKTTGEVHHTANLGFYPSLDVSYDLTDTEQIKLSYSRRTNRPPPSQLNPARYSSDAFNLWAGNPDLKPEEVDSFETSWRDTGETFNVVVTGYYRATYKGIASVYRYLSDTVLLTTLDNLARRLDGGLETNLNATLPHGVTVRATASLSDEEFNPGALAIGARQSGINWDIKGGIDWQATPADFLQFNAHYSGKQHFAQGYSEPTMSGDFGLKHTFGDGLSAVASLNNLFNSWSRTTVLDSPGLYQVGHQTVQGRVYWLGLVYSFGGAKDTEQPAGGETDAGLSADH